MGLFFAGFAAMAGVTNLVRLELARRALLDLPNERSSHSVPTPRGGGLAVLVVFLSGLAFLVLGANIPAHTAMWLSGLTLVLGIVSWLDDMHNLRANLRFFTHVICVALALASGLIEGPIFGGMLPPLADRIVAGLLWVWFINLFNFMDGIDGITGIETLSIAAGSAILLALNGLGPAGGLETGLGLIAVLLAAIGAGFLVFNWHPAKIFLGDVGSIPLGFTLGWLLLSLAANGYWLAALILPLYYLSDATVTLLKRLLRGEKIWLAHREHFYQYAVQNGKTHAQVSGAIAVSSCLLVGLAILSTEGLGFWALIAAFGVVTFLVFWMLKGPPGYPGPGQAE